MTSSLFARGGPSFSQPGFGGPDRVERFRARHDVDEQIRGEFLRWEAPGLAWVDFQGTVLLASMATRPESGATLYFVVKQLRPDIVLQELVLRNVPGALSLLHHFWSTQTRVESGLAEYWPRQEWPDDASSSALRRRAEACRIIREHPDLRSDMDALQVVLQQLNTELAMQGLGRYYSLPWLFHTVQGAGMLVSRGPHSSGAPNTPIVQGAPDGPGARARFTALHPGLGQLEIHLHQDTPPAAWTLHLEHPGLHPNLPTWLYQVFPASNSALRFAGVHPLPRGSQSGNLSRLLVPQESGRFRLNLRV
jgi:hypothetical protein